MAVGFHGTHRRFETVIKPDTALPSRGMGDWLGYGFYIYGANSSATPLLSYAFRDAHDFASEKFGEKTSVLRIRYNDQNLLDLQHQDIYASFKRFIFVLGRRIEGLAVRIDGESDKYRPQLQLQLDAFRTVVESLSNRPIDAMCAQFRDPRNTPRRSIETRRAWEVCIKRSRALLEICPSIEHASLHGMKCEVPQFNSQHYVDAARQAPSLIAKARDSFIIDLLMRAVEAPYRDWNQEPQRFSNASNVLWHDVHGVCGRTPTATAIPEAFEARIDRATINWAGKPSALTQLAEFNELVNKYDGAIFYLRGYCADAAYAAEKWIQEHKPLLILFEDECLLAARAARCAAHTCSQIGRRIRP